MKSVTYARRSLDPEGVSLRTKGLWTLRNVTKNERRLRLIDKLEDRTRDMASCG